MNAAAIAAMIAAPTPIQNVWATARLNAAWMPVDDLGDERRDHGLDAAGTAARIAAPRSPTPVRLLKSSAPLAGRLAEPGHDLRRHARRRSSAGPAARGSVDPKIVPTMASATEPPIWRKNVRLDVATPSCLNGTAFWTTIVKTEKVGPTPRPARNIQSQTIGSGVSAGELGHQRGGDAHQHDRADEQPLVAAGPGHDQARHDRAEDQARPSAAGPRGRSSVGENPWTNWNQRGRKMIAPKNAKLAKKVETIELA